MSRVARDAAGRGSTSRHPAADQPASKAGFRPASGSSLDGPFFFRQLNAGRAAVRQSIETILIVSKSSDVILFDSLRGALVQSTSPGSLTRPLSSVSTCGQPGRSSRRNRLTAAKQFQLVENRSLTRCTRRVPRPAELRKANRGRAEKEGTRQRRYDRTCMGQQ